MTSGIQKGDMDWDTIYGLMEDAIYGGRIDNPYDMRVLRSYLSLFFCNKVASDSGEGISILSGTPLKMPASLEHASFSKVITQLPETDTPSIFCLPDNIDRSLQRTNSSAVIRQLRSLSTIGSEASKFDREKWKLQLSPVLDLWKQMTSSSPLSTNSGKGVSPNKRGALSGDKSEDPISNFVNMECDLAKDICNIVEGTLSSLNKVLFGSGLLTPAIQLVASSLLSDEVPSAWIRQWEGPDKPQKWLRELMGKVISLSKWQRLANSGNLLQGDPLALDDLFHPSTFINALRQQTSRKLGMAIDCVKMVCTWDNGGRKLKNDCPLLCALSGLLLQGATFKMEGELEESAPDAMEMIPSPTVYIGFIPIEAPEPYRLDEALGVPVYLSPSREDFIMELQMPTNNNNNKWILAGVAMFLSGDD
jgi:dynein heavy chain 2